VRPGFAFVSFALIAVVTARGAIRFEDFASTQGLNLVGGASVSGKVLRLTRARPNQSGAVWLLEKQRVASGFESTFQFQLTHQFGLGHGADGFAFVFQNSGSGALGGRGSAGGFAVADASNHYQPGIPWSIAVFFDTFRNSEEGDPSGNYVALCTNGRPAEMRWPAKRLAFTPHLSVRLKDRKVHTARIVYEPPALSVFLDGSTAPVLQTVVDLSIVTDRQGAAWVGFTASTGGGWQNHDILNWSFEETAVSSTVAMVSSDITFSMSACLPNRNLCTPERAIVERTSVGYHVILPANLEWGAAIPNASGRPVSVTNAHGIVCWDFASRGSKGCSGPSGNGPRSGPAGNGPRAGPEFVAPDSLAGALIVTTRDGRTCFSMNGWRGNFTRNEGFYEFDVEIK
jgi:hypothetical protein